MFANHVQTHRQRDLRKTAGAFGFRFAHAALGQGRLALCFGKDFRQGYQPCCRVVMRDMDSMLRPNTKRSAAESHGMARAYSPDRQG